MKGISPMIAVVLIIAFTVAVGGIISVWLSSLTTTQTTATSTEAEKQIKCARSVLEVSEVRYNSDLTRINLTTKYQTGSEALIGFNVFFIDNLRTTTNQTLQHTMNPGDINVTSMTIADATLPGTSLQELRLQSFCQTTYPVIGECKAGEACMVTA